MSAKSWQMRFQDHLPIHEIWQHMVSLEDSIASLALGDRKSTRLNSSHDQISYAVFCLKKKKIIQHATSKQRDAKLPSCVSTELSPDDETRHVTTTHTHDTKVSLTLSHGRSCLCTSPA